MAVALTQRVDVLGGRVDPLLVDFLRLLPRKGRIEYAGPAVRRFRRLVELAAGIRQADVVSARPLDDDEKQRLTRSLEAFTSSKLRIRWSVDPRIIGGIRFTCDDLLVDNSVRMHLDTLRSRLEAVMHH